MMTDAEMTSRCLIAFMLAICIIFSVSKIIGEQRKALWFKKRNKSNIFTRRGFLGDSCNFGVPQTWQGILVGILMLGGISFLGYFILFEPFI
jgi:hypothetical protein